MNLKRHTVISLFVGLQAGVIMIIDQLIHSGLPPAGNVGFSWLSFLGWATYFMAGCTTFDGLRAFFGFIKGIVASIIIIVLAGYLGFLGFFAVPISVAAIAWLLFYFEGAPQLFNFVPSFYVASGAFFGCMNYVPNATFGTIFLTEMVYLTLGLFFGWMTITFRTWFDANIQFGHKKEAD